MNVRLQIKIVSTVLFPLISYIITILDNTVVNSINYIYRYIYKHIVCEQCFNSNIGYNNNDSYYADSLLSSLNGIVMMLGPARRGIVNLLGTGGILTLGVAMANAYRNAKDSKQTAEHQEYLREAAKQSLQLEREKYEYSKKFIENDIANKGEPKPEVNCTMGILQMIVVYLILHYMV